ncbi:MAG TPA: hypothetical protein VGH80_08685 [Xanthomonadaceae bacterium]
MRCRTLFASLALGLALAAPMAFAQQFSSVEERMSSSDFKAAGLDKLSPEELAKLNAFIRGEMGKRTAQAHEEGMREQDRTEASRMGFKDYHGEVDELESRIPGTFTGWDDGSTFTLANGQVWRVVDARSPLEGIKMTNPVVHIRPGAFDSWIFSVEGYNKSAKVERIQ